MIAAVATGVLVRVPAGIYHMGGVSEDKFVTAVELPRHEVAVAAFALGAAPVTRAEWREVMGGPAGSPDDDALPVVGVDFPAVMAYLAERSAAEGARYRLPCEAEWEYACRAGGGGVFPRGTSLLPADANFLYDEHGEAVGPGVPTPAGAYPPNAFGLHDMLGNICEWTADLWHPGFAGAPTDGTPWLAHGHAGRRVIRGGGWDHLPRVLRASWRDWAPESARWDNLGFRVARDL